MKERSETGRTGDLVHRLVQLASLESQSTLSGLQPSILREEFKGLVSSIDTKNLINDAEEISANGIKLTGDPLMLRIAVRNLITKLID